MPLPSKYPRKEWYMDVLPDIANVLRWAVLILSVLLLIAVSVITFGRLPFLDNAPYMHFQFFVCIVFIADFAVELTLSTYKARYFRRHFLFLLISLPWLNIFTIFSHNISDDTLFFLRFIPLARAAIALASVTALLTFGKLGGMLLTYSSVVIMMIYFGSLIFYQCEAPINEHITSYPQALWYCCMEATTIGADFNPLSVTGKIISFILASMGMMMFPLFTVYISSLLIKLSPHSRKSSVNHKS